MKILVPVDGSALSLEAVRHALALVRNGLRADLVLANVQAPASLYEIVVAHDPDVIKVADHVVDMGPHAGTAGGRIVFEGSYAELLQDLCHDMLATASRHGVVNIEPDLIDRLAHTAALAGASAILAHRPASADVGWSD